MATKTVWIILLCLFVVSQADQGFDVRHHLSTVTRFFLNPSYFVVPEEVELRTTLYHLGLIGPIA